MNPAIRSPRVWWVGLASAWLAVSVSASGLKPASNQVLALAWIVCTLLAAFKAYDGQPYRYPITIRLFK